MELNLDNKTLEMLYECRSELYQYYIENQDKFKTRPSCIKEAVVDYADVNELPMPKEWFMELDEIVADKDKIIPQVISNYDKSRNAYYEALKGAWSSYTDTQKIYVVEFAKSRGLFIPKHFEQDILKIHNY